jgi:hypothetical protein
MKPESGKPSENNSSCGKSENWRDIFNSDPFGLNLANDSQVLKPEPGVLSFNSGPLAGHGEISAGEAPNDSSHAATVESAREGSDIRPDRSLVKAPIFHARRQNAGCADFPLAVTDAASIWNCESDGQVESGRSGEETDIELGSFSHIGPP